MAGMRRKGKEAEEERKGLGALPKGGRKLGWEAPSQPGDRAGREGKEEGKGQRKRVNLLLLSLETLLGCLRGSRQPQRRAQIPKEGGR